MDFLEQLDAKIKVMQFREEQGRNLWTGEPLRGQDKVYWALDHNKRLCGMITERCRKRNGRWLYAIVLDGEEEVIHVTGPSYLLAEEKISFCLLLTNEELFLQKVQYVK